MGNGEWGMGNGEWGMGNGEWGMGKGEWGMGKVTNTKHPTPNTQHQIYKILRPVNTSRTFNIAVYVGKICSVSLLGVRAKAVLIA